MSVMNTLTAQTADKCRNTDFGSITFYSQQAATAYSHFELAVYVMQQNWFDNAVGPDMMTPQVDAYKIPNDI